MSISQIILAVIAVLCVFYGFSVWVRARRLMASRAFVEKIMGKEGLAGYDNLMETMAKARSGDADAQASLGVRYYEGDGVTQNYAEAVKWYRKAANQGNSGAQNNLGVAYNLGHGVVKNEVESAKWFRMAAERGEAAAQYSLGVAYAKVEDFVQAHAWASLSLAGHYETAAELIGEMEFSWMTPAQITEAKELARKLNATIKRK